MKIAEAEQLSIAEERALKRVAKVAYKATENIKNPEIQRHTYTLIAESVKAGILIMQEELMNITETNSPNQ